MFLAFCMLTLRTCFEHVLSPRQLAVLWYLFDCGPVQTYTCASATIPFCSATVWKDVANMMVKTHKILFILLRFWFSAAKLAKLF